MPFHEKGGSDLAVICNKLSGSSAPIEKEINILYSTECSELTKTLCNL